MHATVLSLQAAAAAFASLDTDGSGYLEPAELCRAFRTLEGGLSDEEMRVLLAYLHLGVDKVGSTVGWIRMDPVTICSAGLHFLHADLSHGHC
jgi:hypothetical protein